MLYLKNLRSHGNYFHSIINLLFILISKTDLTYLSDFRVVFFLSKIYLVALNYICIQKGFFRKDSFKAYLMHIPVNSLEVPTDIKSECHNELQGWGYMEWDLLVGCFHINLVSENAVD